MKRNICSRANLRQCLGTLQILTQNSEFVEVKTKKQLQEACGKFKESFKCVDRHLKRCFGQTERKVYNHVVAGARNLIDELCIPGKAQDDFLKHAECYNNISSQSEQCSEIYTKVIYHSEQSDQDEDVEKGLKRTCCTFRNFVQCRIDMVIRQCGSETGSYVQSHLEEISDPLIHEHCASFSYSSHECMREMDMPKDMAQTKSSVVSSFVLALFLFYKILLPRL